MGSLGSWPDHFGDIRAGTRQPLEQVPDLVPPRISRPPGAASGTRRVNHRPQWNRQTHREEGRSCPNRVACMREAARKTIIVAPEQGRVYSMGPMRAIFKADRDETAGRYSVSEWWLEPHTRGPGVHLHP